MSKPDDPMLPPKAVDAVLLLKTYHEVADPVTLLAHVRSALRPGARVGIIDRDGNGTDHGVSQKIVTEEAVQAGYHLVQTYDFVKDDGMNYFLLFTLKPGSITPRADPGVRDHVKTRDRIQEHLNQSQ